MQDPTAGACRARIVSRARDWIRGAPIHAFGGTPLLDAELPQSARCGRPLHLTFDFDLSDPRLVGLGITSVRRLAILACFHVGYQAGAPLFVQHEDEGRKLRLLREPRGRILDTVPDTLPQLPVELEPLNVAESAVEFADELPDDSPPVHRAGGHPVWARAPFEPPRCPATGNAMRYVASVDSMRRFPLGEDETALVFGDGGICYVFWSDEPAISAAVIQSR